MMLRLFPAVIVVLITVMLGPPPAAAAAPPELVAQAEARAEFFGMVGRDPWYTLDVDGHVVADRAPVEFLDRMAADLAQLGVRWVRIEFHAEITDKTGPGWIDYRKYDAFIREIAPRHGLKVLALLNTGILSDTDPLYQLLRLEDPPDQAGPDPTDLSNNYIRVFTGRAREIADHYGSAIAAYEILNEPNINAQKMLLTQNTSQEIDAERVGTLLTNTYLAIKPNHPQIPVIMGGMLHGAPLEKPYRVPSDYIAEVYQAPRVQWFFQTRPLGPEHVFPWDGVALHPYDLTPENVETHIREVKARMASVGDLHNRIWVTEIGKQAEPPPIRPDWLMEPSPQEIEQADYLTQVYNRLLEMPSLVERVFWFKYEDFREEGRPRNWGLVRLREDGQGQYDPSVIPYPRKPAYAAYQRLANPSALPTAPRPPRVAPSPGARYFPQTGHEINSVFVRYWEQYGGLARFGMPRTAAFQQGGYLVQYFERARFEYHPEHKGTANEVQLGLLGRQVVEHRLLQASQAPPATQAPPPNPNATLTRFFPETRRTLAGGFKYYWEQNDGLRLFGLPITDERREVNPADGKMYTVQYFERARFEYHPEHKGTPHEVQLGLIGNQILAEANWYR